MSTTNEQRLREAYDKQYPEHRGVASQQVRNHYGSFKTGWLCALAASPTAATREPAAPVDAREAMTVLRDLWQQVIFYQYSFPKGFMPRELGVRVNAVLDASPIARQAAASEPAAPVAAWRTNWNSQIPFPPPNLAAIYDAREKATALAGKEK